MEPAKDWKDILSTCMYPWAGPDTHVYEKKKKKKKNTCKSSSSLQAEDRKEKEAAL